VKGIDVSEQAAAQTTPKLPFEKTQNIVISVNVSDLERSIAWWSEMLGFEPTYVMKEYGWCELATSIEGVGLGLGQVEEVKVSGGVTPTFGVSDIDAARGHMESRGVRFDGDTYEISGQVKLCTFYDPDANPFMLAEVLDDKSAR
jgi:catechol 2,3-dioxygenase-like lactoylglutathione lyase family enzyme